MSKRVKRQRGGGGIPRRREIFLRCFLDVESDKGTTFLLDCKQNIGEFFKAGMAWYICCSDAIGHNGDDPRQGMAIVLTSLLFWSVLDQLIITVHECWENMRPPLV